MFSAAQNASADIVKVGLEVPSVAMFPQPTRNRIPSHGAARQIRPRPIVPPTAMREPGSRVSERRGSPWRIKPLTPAQLAPRVQTPFRLLVCMFTSWLDVARFVRAFESGTQP